MSRTTLHGPAGSAAAALRDAVYNVAVTANRAATSDQIYEAALDALTAGLGVNRAAVLVTDDDGIMRFRAWRRLSTPYRETVEGHNPWTDAVGEPEPVLVPDVLEDPSLTPLRTTLADEGIAAMAFIPLVHAGALVGKFMLYYDLHHRFTDDELWLAQTVASHVAAAVGRQATDKELRFKNALLASQSEATLDGILVVSPEGKIISFNQRFVEMWEIPDTVLASQEDDDALAYVLNKLVDPRAFLERVAALYRHPDQKGRDEIALKDGRVFDRWSSPLVADGDAYYGRAWYFRDVTEQKRQQRVLEESHARLATLASMTAQLLAASLDNETLLDRVADVVVHNFADYCSIAEIDEDGSVGRVRSAATGALASDVAAADPSPGTGLHSAHPLYDVVRTSRSLLLHDARQVPALDVTSPSSSSDDVAASAMIVPVLGRGRLLGAITIIAAGSNKRYDEADLLLAEEFGGRVGLALEQARLHEAERKARVEAEKARADVAFLLEASALLAADLDYREGFHRLARLAASALCDLCLIDVVGPEGSIVRAAAAAADPNKQELADVLRRKYPPDPAGSHPSVRVIRSGRPEFATYMPEELMRATTRDAEHLAITQRFGFVSYMSVPIATRGKVLGALTLVSTVYSGRRYGPDDVQLAEDLARRAALVFDNALAYEQKSRLARTLQQSLLPPRVPSVPGLDLAARYIAAHGDIGGDFYDVFSLGGNRWLVAMGDVCGKGASAAALTSMVRYTLRAAAMQDASPARMLTIVNEALMLQVAESEFCTLACAVLQQEPGSAKLTVAVGGHPLPLVLRRDGSVDRAGRAGSLLGVLPEPDVHEHDLTLGPGDAIVLFTDGALDEPDAREETAEARLLQALRAAAGEDAAGLAAALEEAATANRTARHNDDTAILVLRLED